MGLAASQCRFLMLTSRQNDVEARLMTLSNQQMALSSQSAQLSSDYAKALSSQSVYFNDRLVSYSEIMAPNMVADAQGVISQYLFTTNKGAVVLSPSIAQNIGVEGSGTGKDFKNLFPNKQTFLNKMIKEFNADEDTTTDSYVDESTAYRYDDSLMNNAVVSVTPASVLNLSNYNLESLEYAMGTQSNKLDAYACIWSLDKYQYTESNVHSVTNAFVQNSVEAMAEQLLSDNALGGGDAVVYATDYAKQKTIEYYRNAPIETSPKNVNEALDSLDNKTNFKSSPAIYVSEGTYTTTTTTGESSDGQTLEITSLTGKDVFVNTAQLTAVFLNYFDAGMLYAMANAMDNGSLKETDKNTSESLRKKADALAELNKSYGEKATNGSGVMNNTPLSNRLNKEGILEGLGGYAQKQLTDTTYANASSGFFGNTLNIQQATNNLTGSSTVKAQKEFYGHMYDTIVASGWVTNELVQKDKSFLSNQIEQGNIVLHEFNSNYADGRKLSLDDSDSGLDLVDDTETIEQAEADYEAESARIDYKTTIIETQMQSLQTELDSISKEKESVKTIITKQVEGKFNILS